MNNWTDLFLVGWLGVHDITFKNFNIDHVIIGSTGVYVVETKTKRKQSGDPKAHKVSYDGTKLIFSNGSFDVKALEQTKLNAETLRKIIADEAKEIIPVYPILTYPGWKIDRTGKGLANVVNPEEIPQALSSFKNATLSTGQLEKIEIVLNNCNR